MLVEAKAMDEAKFTAEPERKPLIEVGHDAGEETMHDADGSQVEGQDSRRRGGRIVSIFGWRK